MEVLNTINTLIKKKSEQWNLYFQVILCYSRLCITLEMSLMLHFMNFQQALHGQNSEQDDSLSLIANSLNLLR